MKKVSLIALLLSLSLLLASCGSSPSDPDSSGAPQAGGNGGDSYTLTVACFFPAGGAYETEILNPLNELLQEKSEGRLGLELYMGGQLMAAGDTFDSVASGMADIGVSYMATVPGRYPVSAITELPLEFASAESVTYALNEFLGEEPPAEFDGLKVLMFYASGPAALMSQKPIETIDDMKGIQIRVNSNLVDEFNALGATPVTMTMSETYEGLRTGVVDAYVGAVESVGSSRLYEVTTNMSFYPLMNASHAMVMNPDSFSNLPEDLQTILMDSCQEILESRLATEFDDQGLIALQECKDAGVTINTIPDDEIQEMLDRTQPLLDDYAKVLDEAGYDGIALIEQWKEILEKYNEMYPCVFE